MLSSISTLQMCMILLCTVLVIGLGFYATTQWNDARAPHEEFSADVPDGAAMASDVVIEAQSQGLTEQDLFTEDDFTRGTTFVYKEKLRSTKRADTPVDSVTHHVTPKIEDDTSVTISDKFCVNIHCTFKQKSSADKILASIKYNHRDASDPGRRVYKTVQVSFAVKPLQTNERILKIDIPTINANTVVGNIRIMSVRLDYESGEAPLLIEAVTVSKEDKTIANNDDDGCNTELVNSDVQDVLKSSAQNHTTYQGLMIPFTLYNSTKTLSTSGMWTTRPVGSSFVMGMSNYEYPSTHMRYPQTRVFRGKLTLLAKDNYYPDSLRFLFFVSSNTNKFPVEVIQGNNFKWSDANLSQIHRPRSCVVDVNVRGRGMGSIHHFYISLLSTSFDALYMIPYCNDAAKTHLPEILLHLMPLSTSNTRKPLTVLPRKHEWEQYRYGQTQLIVEPSHDNPMMCCSTIPVPTWLRRRSTIIDFLAHGQDHNETYVNGVGCAGQGVCLYGKFICNTSVLDGSSNLEKEQLLLVTLHFETGQSLALRLTRQDATIGVGQEEQTKPFETMMRPVCTTKPAKEGVKISASTEVIYFFAIYDDTVTIMVSAFGSEHLNFNTGLLRSSNSKNYPRIVRAGYEVSDAIEQQECTLCTEIQGLPRTRDFTHSDKIEVLEQDVRGCASPLFHMWAFKNFTMHLTKPVHLRHMSLILFTHTFLLRNALVFATHYGGAKTLPEAVVVAAYGPISIVLKSSQLVLVLPGPREIVLVDQNFIQRKIAMLQISITHPGKPAIGGGFKGHLCIEQTSAWQSNWGEKDTAVLPIECTANSGCTPGVDYVVQDEQQPYNQLTLHGFLVVHAMQMGKALPHVCGSKDFTPTYPHHTASSLNNEMHKMMLNWKTTLSHRMEQKHTPEHADDTFNLSIQSPQQRREQQQGFKMLRPDHECKGDSTDLGEAGTVGACAQKCRDQTGCQYFIYGKGDKQKKCYWEQIDPSAGCTEWEQDAYDFYTLT